MSSQCNDLKQTNKQTKQQQQRQQQQNKTKTTTNNNNNNDNNKTKQKTKTPMELAENINIFFCHLVYRLTDEKFYAHLSIHLVEILKPFLDFDSGKNKKGKKRLTPSLLQQDLNFYLADYPR